MQGPLRLVRRLVEAVYRAQSCQIVSESISLSVAVVANGDVLQLGGLDAGRELMLSTGCIWRVCSGIARAIDAVAPIGSNLVSLPERCRAASALP